MIYVESQPRPEWSTLPREGCVNVEARVLLAKDGLVVANLRFGRDASIDRHDAPFDIDVVCISGSGFASIDDGEFSIRAGETVRWPKNRDHRLWTTGDMMETVMIERHGV
jgi:quercetin dioxygenase-like cupin family protein